MQLSDCQFEQWVSRTRDALVFHCLLDIDFLTEDYLTEDLQWARTVPRAENSDVYMLQCLVHIMGKVSVSASLQLPFGARNLPESEDLKMSFVDGKDLESHLEKSEQETLWQKVNFHRHTHTGTFIFSNLRPENLRITFASLTHPEKSPPKWEVFLLISPLF